MLTSLCVYCGASAGYDVRYARQAETLGRAAAERGVRIVYGGGLVGLMAEVAAGARQAGGDVLGIIPRFLLHREAADAQAGSGLEVVASMHERKMRMFEESDAFCVLPGGLGTLDEALEMLTWRQLGLHDKPLVLLNLNSFWDPLLTLLNHQAKSGFLRREHLAFVTVVEEVEAVFEAATKGGSATGPGMSTVG